MRKLHFALAVLAVLLAAVVWSILDQNTYGTAPSLDQPSTTAQEGTPSSDTPVQTTTAIQEGQDSASTDEPSQGSCGDGYSPGTYDDPDENFLVNCEYGFTIHDDCTLTCNSKPVDVRIVH